MQLLFTLEPGTFDPALPVMERRGVLEETGMRVIPGSERPFGLVLERRRDYRDPGLNFLHQSFCYLCDTEDAQTSPAMTAQELSWGLHPVWVTLEEAIRTNETLQTESWARRDTCILRRLREAMTNDKEVCDQ